MSHATRSRSKCALVAAVAATVTSIAGSNALAAILYNPVVEMVGTGAATTSGAGYTTSIQLFNNTTANQASPVSTVSYVSSNSVTNSRLVTSVSGTSEGSLTNNPGISDKAALGLAYTGTTYAYSAGYDAVTGTTTVNSTATNANRVVGRVTVGSTSVTSPTIITGQTQATAYDNNNIRGATGLDNGTSVYTAGTGTAANAGWRYFPTNTQVAASPTNVRTVEVLNGQLFGSTGSGTVGIYAVGTGTPTTAGTSSLLVGTSASPYEFALFNDPATSVSTTSTFGFDTAYVTDDSSTASGGGIKKYTYNGTAWSLAYTLNDGVGGNRGLSGTLDAATGKFTLFATTAAGTKLEQVTDTGVGSMFTTLATAAANTVFRGVALAPVAAAATNTISLGVNNGNLQGTDQGDVATTGGNGSYTSTVASTGGTASGYVDITGALPSPDNDPIAIGVDFTGTPDLSAITFTGAGGTPAFSVQTSGSLLGYFNSAYGTGFDAVFVFPNASALGASLAGNLDFGYNLSGLTVERIAAIPEPGTWLASTVAAGLLLLGRRRRSISTT